jgi:hypothetical protein
VDITGENDGGGAEGIGIPIQPLKTDLYTVWIKRVTVKDY